MRRLRNPDYEKLLTMRISQLFPLLAFSLAMAFPGYAQTVYIDLTAQGFSNAEDVSGVTSDGVTLLFSQGEGQNHPKFYTKGNAVRIYGGNTLQVSAGKPVTSIILNFVSPDEPSSSNLDVDTGTASPGAVTTWEGSASTIVFTNTAKSGHWKLQSISVGFENDPDMEEVTSISALRGLDDGSTVRLVLGRDNPGCVEWVDEQSGTFAYVRDNHAAVRFCNFLPDDAGWHTKRSGALIGSVVGEYHFRNGMPEFTHVSTSIADSILCLDNWHTPEPVAVSDLSVLQDATYRADFVEIKNAALTMDGNGGFSIEIGDQKLPMTDYFGLGISIPQDLNDRSFSIEGILGVAEDGVTSVLYCTQMTENVPDILLDEAQYTNTSAIAAYLARYVNVTLNRKLIGGMWNTLCLPFSVADFSASIATAKLAKLTAFDASSNSLNFSSVEGIEAGVPYLVQPEEDIDKIVVNGTIIDNMLSPLNCGSYEMIPIYNPTTLHAGDESVLFLGEDNTLCRPSVTCDLKAFRAYFKTTAAQVADICIDGISTGIRTLMADECYDNSRIYHVGGQFVGHDVDRLQKGVYISGNRKIVVK